MYNLFADAAPVKAPLSEDRKTGIKETNLDSAVQQQVKEIPTIKIGALVRNEFDKLISKGLITEQRIRHLSDKKFCKESFDINYPMIKKVREDKSLFDQRTINGYSRFFSKIYSINGEKYLLCNDWYERSRTKFLNWLAQLK